MLDKYVSLFEMAKVKKHQADPFIDVTIPFPAEFEKLRRSKNISMEQYISTVAGCDLAGENKEMPMLESFNGLLYIH